MEERKESTSSTTCNLPQGNGRMGKLLVLLEKMLKQLWSKTRLIDELENVDVETLRILHQKTIDQTQQFVKMEWDQLFTEENVESLLNKLDLLSTNSASVEPSEQTPIWRPTGNVAEDSRPFIASLLRSKKEVLQKTLSHLEAKNKLLRNAVQKMEERLLHQCDQVFNQVATFQKLTENTRKTLEESDLVKKIIEDN